MENVIVSDRLLWVLSISSTDFLGFACTTVSRVYSVETAHKQTNQNVSAMNVSVFYCLQALVHGLSYLSLSSPNIELV